MGQVQDNISFYAEHYAITQRWHLRPDDRIILGDKANRVCRFCGRPQPEVTFRKDAHALPESVGNRGLLTYYECDACNQSFGVGCENDFGNWTLPMRTLARISGKNGIPSIKQGPGNAWRIDQRPTGFEISVSADEGFFTEDPVAKTLTFTLKRAPYRPAMVAQAFFKMALSVMPEEELPKFRDLLDWIKPGLPQKMGAPIPVIHSFVGGAWERDVVRILLLTRLSPEAPFPYCFFILSFGNEMFQVIVPSNENDSHLYGEKITLPTLPFCGNEDAVLAGSTRTHSLLSDDWVRDGELKVTLAYESSTPRTSK